MQTLGRWGQLDGGRGDNGNVFATVATEALRFARSDTSHLQHVIAPGSDWSGGNSAGKSWGSNRSRELAMTKRGRLGGVTVRQVEGKKCSEKGMVSEQGRGKELNIHIGEI